MADRQSIVIAVMTEWLTYDQLFQCDGCASCRSPWHQDWSITFSTKILLTSLVVFWVVFLFGFLSTGLSVMFWFFLVAFLSGFLRLTKLVARQLFNERTPHFYIVSHSIKAVLLYLIGMNARVQGHDWGVKQWNTLPTVVSLLQDL